MKTKDRLVVTVGLLGFLFALGVAGNRGCSLPDIIPDITPDVAPFPAPSLHVLIVEESSNRNLLPASQLQIFTSVPFRETIQQAGGQLRIIDPSDTDMTNIGPVWKAALDRPRESLPWIAISNGQSGTEQPLPQTLNETLSLVLKYAPTP